MFTMTPAAAREVLAAARRSDALGVPLRVAARAQDDGSLEFGMGFDDERAEDRSVEVEGLRVLVGASSARWLDGIELDFVEIEPGRFDFVFAPQSAPDKGAGAGCGGGGCSRCGG